MIRLVFPDRLHGARNPRARILLEGKQVMDNKRLAGIPGEDAASKTRQVIGGVIVVAVLVAAIIVSILVSPTIIPPH
ncbi:hypothetical protein HLH36_03365 [Gluconacetobacter aggeris]|uniref:Uncharacterized protein n=1 Tax=Gluconacetobacter aggeris TaxID=1286186 RepID=A0A7W4IR36_9PROT|nr:hypothetical protein [Gluconacetobacter aggeris]MBB2167403.1 hypothetical protein [Gluconacetobacter aggeris]